MNCDEALTRLEELRAGTLSAEEAGLVRAHVSDCPVCAADLAFLDRLEGDIARLPGEILPPRDLWPGIDARLAPPRSARHWLAAAAIITLLAIGTAVVAALLSPRPAPAPPDAIAAMETEYRSASTELLTAVESGEGSLTPRMVQVVEQNLRIADAAIAELRDALRDNPGNTGLELMLRAAWEKKLDLLRRAAAASREA